MANQVTLLWPPHYCAACPLPQSTCFGSFFTAQEQLCVCRSTARCPLPAAPKCPAKPLDTVAASDARFKNKGFIYRGKRITQSAQTPVRVLVLFKFDALSHSHIFRIWRVTGCHLQVYPVQHVGQVTRSRSPQTQAGILHWLHIFQTFFHNHEREFIFTIQTQFLLHSPATISKCN